MKKTRANLAGNTRRRRALSRVPGRSEIAWFRQRLQYWFEYNRREFPWRSSPDPYVICIAEVFLQQTTAAKVADFLGAFTSRFPDWNALAKATPDEIQGVIFPLGLYRRRAQTIHSLASAVVKLDGLPRTRQGLEKLPGIGQYIANVLLVVLQHKRVPFLDTNMSRVLERFFGPRELADIRDDPYLQTLARKIVNVRDTLYANWMILDFAAIVCTKRRPRCLDCPLSKRCRYIQEA